MDMEVLKFQSYLKKNYPYLFLATFHHRNHKGNPITFENYSFMREIYCDKADFMVVMKSTQVGLTEYLITRAIWKATQGRSIFYVMPTDGLKNTFVKDRFDRTMQATKYYAGLKAESKELIKSESLGLKHIGKGSINFVGSNSPVPFVSYPADDLFIDEVDQCDQENIQMADERLSNSVHKQIIKVSNPTYGGFGIEREYKTTDQKKWFIKCEHCGVAFTPDFFKNVVKEVEEKTYVLLDNSFREDGTQDIKMICHKCGKPIDRYTQGEWVAEYPNNPKSGYQISKLFSTTTKLVEIVERFEKGLKDDFIMQRFYNGDLGVTYTASGSKISIEMLNLCKREYNLKGRSKQPCVCGIDVGTVLHVVVGEIQPDGSILHIYIGELHDEKDVFELAQRYYIVAGCVDALPETRMSKKITYGLKRFFSVFFGNVKQDSINLEAKTITVDRTGAMDAVKEMYQTQRLLLPQNADKLNPVEDNGFSSFYNMLLAPTRTYVNNRYSWQEGSLKDHYFLADTYMLIAHRVALKVLS